MVVIINADDLGISREVNDAIFRLMEEGAVTSATMLTNGAAVEHAAPQVSRFPQASFGVHLNLTEFQAVAPTPGLSAILDEAGCFRGNHIREIAITQELKAAIFQEWCAQIEKVIGLGIRPSHLDSHHHTHTLPALLPVLGKVAKKYGIPKVRISRNIFLPGEPFTLKMKKAAYNTSLRYLAGFTTTDLFSGFDMFLQTGNGVRRRAKSIELMVHPGAQGSEQETSQLLHWVGSRGHDLRLISYKDL